ncbi:MAG: hypothetical protein AAGA56_28895 [Myxococcota bacterium]
MSVATLFLGSTALAETSSLEGLILDARDHQPVSGATVFTLPPTHVACSDAEGRYRLSFPRGFSTTLVVVAVAPGRNLQRTEVATGTKRRARADMLMRRAADASIYRGRCRPRTRAIDSRETWVTGFVLDAATFAPVPQAFVRVGPKPHRSRTDRHGIFRIRLGRAAPSEVRVWSCGASRSGYHRATGRIAIRRGDKRRCDLRLLKQESAAPRRGPKQKAPRERPPDRVDPKRKPPDIGNPSLPRRRHVDGLP